MSLGNLDSLPFFYLFLFSRLQLRNLTLPVDERCLIFRVDPPGEELGAACRRHLWALELVPIGQAVMGNVPVGHKIVPPQEGAVEGARPLHQAVSVHSGDDQLDQLVDHRILYAHEIAATRPISCDTAPISTLLVPRRQ